MTKEEKLKAINEMNNNTLMETLGIVFTDIGEDFLEGTMPVDSRVHQPLGMLHGGASIAFAESLGSCLSNIVLLGTGTAAVGIEISANHLKSKKEGMVTATAKIIHKGASIHLWEIRIVDENDKLISLCKLTNMILPRR